MGTGSTCRTDTGIGRGAYLDVNNPGGDLYDVTTSKVNDRQTRSGTWEIVSATGKTAGSEVVSGDVIHLRNLYGSAPDNGGFLDVNGSAPAGNLYDVSTARKNDRQTGSGRWRVFAETSSPIDGKVRVGDTVRFLNGYSDWNGGFLDVNGGAPGGNLYSVSTSRYSNRQTGSGTWRFAKSTA